MSTDFAHKNILVLGAGVTGKSVARFLQSRGAQVTLTDDNSEGAVKPSEVNLKDFEAAGLVPVGKNPETGLVEIVEIKDHPWFVGAQFHPEYKSTVANPHPLFVAFIKAAIDHNTL
jgi:CTP synthase (UTP-ammonia lyase)